MSSGDIDATNVLPAYRASVEIGVSHEALARATGWSPAELERDGAVVSGESTYRHMEFMFGRGDYLEFVRRAAAMHGASSLGVVGLACKTAPSVAAALQLHARYQHLTNRTAHYVQRVEGDRLRLTERRRGDGSRGERLLSDYTLLVAHRLLTTLAAAPPQVLAATGRFEGDEAYAASFAEALGAPFVTGASVAELVLDASILTSPVVGADEELSAFFKRAIGASEPEPDPLLLRVREAIRAQLIHGEPAAAAVAHSLALGQRTMQRRLAELGTTFRDLFDDERRSLAADYLAREDLSLGEVAFLLGFAERASFFKAFRRWYDTTPDAYRRGTASR